MRKIDCVLLSPFRSLYILLLMLILSGCTLGDPSFLDDRRCDSDGQCELDYQCEKGFCQMISDTADITPEVCIPSCAYRECGFDPVCGDSCGTCYPPDICQLGSCVCVSDCSSLDCGPDPECGESCGECAPPDICQSGNCVCVPDCSYRDCGFDPVCGDSCGTCYLPDICQLGSCVCIPDCSGLDCGSDPVCRESCGECDSFDICQSGSCVCISDCSGSAMATIPSGPFMMGCNSDIDDDCDSDENPYHEVNVSDFEIDLTEVTVGQYRACVENGSSCSEPSTSSDYCNWGYSAREDYPVNCITWYDAKEYCEWVGKRLCSESEWEKAARGTDGRIYPWGNEAPDCTRAVMSGCPGDTQPVGSKPAGVHGLYDMSGNVWEWVEDDLHYTYDVAPSDGEAWVENPRASDRVLRGGSFDFYAAFLRASVRGGGVPGDSSVLLGTRCCSSTD